MFKLSVHMQHTILNTPLQTIMDCSIDDVIRSRNKSKLWTAIAMSKYELEKRSKAHNVGNWTGYQKFKFQIHIQISKFWQVRNLRLPFHLIVWSDSLGWKGPEYFLKSYLCTQNTCYFFFNFAFISMNHIYVEPNTVIYENLPNLGIW